MENEKKNRFQAKTKQFQHETVITKGNTADHGKICPRESCDIENGKTTLSVRSLTNIDFYFTKSIKDKLNNINSCQMQITIQR